MSGRLRALIFSGALSSVFARSESRAEAPIAIPTVEGMRTDCPGEIVRIAKFPAGSLNEPFGRSRIVQLGDRLVWAAYENEGERLVLFEHDLNGRPMGAKRIELAPKARRSGIDLEAADGALFVAGVVRGDTMETDIEVLRLDASLNHRWRQVLDQSTLDREPKIAIADKQVIAVWVGDKIGERSSVVSASLDLTTGKVERAAEIDGIDDGGVMNVNVAVTIDHALVAWSIATGPEDRRGSYVARIDALAKPSSRHRLTTTAGGAAPTVLLAGKETIVLIDATTGYEETSLGIFRFGPNLSPRFRRTISLGRGSVSNVQAELGADGLVLGIDTSDVRSGNQADSLVFIDSNGRASSSMDLELGGKLLDLVNVDGRVLAIQSESNMGGLEAIVSDVACRKTAATPAPLAADSCDLVTRQLERPLDPRPSVLWAMAPIAQDAWLLVDADPASRGATRTRVVHADGSVSEPTPLAQIEVAHSLGASTTRSGAALTWRDFDQQVWHQSLDVGGRVLRAPVRLSSVPSFDLGGPCVIHLREKTEVAFASGRATSTWMTLEGSKISRRVQFPRRPETSECAFFPTPAGLSLLLFDPTGGRNNQLDLHVLAGPIQSEPRPQYAAPTDWPSVVLPSEPGELRLLSMSRPDSILEGQVTARTYNTDAKLSGVAFPIIPKAAPLAATFRTTASGTVVAAVDRSQLYARQLCAEQWVVP